MEFVDSHCHLDLSDFSADCESIIERSRELGVKHFVVPGVDLPIKKTLHHGSVVQGLGLHPWWLPDFLNRHPMDAVEHFLNTALEDAPFVAIGETGLDRQFAKNQTNGDFKKLLEYQVASLQIHIKVANRAKLPIILHSVKTHADLLSVLNQCQPEYGGVVHGFSGSFESAKQLVDKGLKIGVGGTITYERAKKTRDAVKGLNPKDMILETDSPSMPIAGKQGQRNLPQYIPEIARCLAQLRGESLEEVASYTTANAKKLFGIL